MDNPLTPNKIQRLMHLAADDKSFGIPTRRLLLGDEDLRRLASNQAAMNRSTIQTCETSSGILDLDRVEGFGESALGDMSLSKSTAFNPGEMTGRSTGATDFKAMPLGRHSIALDSITSQMDKQTSEIQDIMRHSIASNNYSFNSIHSKRELTADEASLIMREAPIPVPIQNITHSQFPEMSMNSSNMSVGAYFKNRCPEFAKILGKTDSPDRNVSIASNVPSITEVSTANLESFRANNQPFHKMDQSLDCVPVRQPRNNTYNLEKQNNITKAYEQSIAQTNEPQKLAPPMSSKAPEKPENFYMSLVPDKPKYVPMNLNTSPHKAGPEKDRDHLLKTMHSLQLNTEDTEGSGMENSLSISKIADYIGKQSNVSVTDMLQYNNQKKQANKKQPLNELHLNILDSKKNQDCVTHLKDTLKMETASSSGTLSTVISTKNYKVDSDIPAVVVTRHSLKDEDEDTKSKRTTRSKSPSSKSHSTLSTVQENYTSFKSGDSPVHSSRGEANTSHVPSPNIVYKELDKSVDWRDVMQQKMLKQESLAKDQWVEIESTVANGYVGVGCQAVLTVTTLLDSWLTSKLQFNDLPNNGKDISIDMPRMPLLLSPGKSEVITLNITSNVELNTMLHYTMHIKDAATDGDIEQKGQIEVNIKMPVLQAMSCDGVNKVTFPPIPENSWHCKSFVLLSDTPTDLQLVLTVVEGESIFTIKSVQEIKKSEVNKVLMDREGSADDGQGRGKNKVINKQLCRLTSGNAIRVSIRFNAPAFSNLQMDHDSILTFNGSLEVNLLGVSTVLRKVDLIGVMGTVQLAVKTPSNNKLHVTNEPTNIELSNTGTVPGTWLVKITSNDNPSFKISPSKVEVRPGGVRTVSLMYTGDGLTEATLTFEDISSGKISSLEIIGGTDKPKTFPIKTNYNTISWVRAGRKELSLKNATNKKIYVRCHIIGEGFGIDMPRESRGQLSLPFGPLECRPLPIIFSPTSIGPHKAMLHLVYDRNTDYSRKIALYGCASGDPIRWSGLVTYGETALVRAVSRTPINLELYNKSATPAFVYAKVHFNLQYQCMAASAELSGARQLVRARSRHAVALRVDWARLERRARTAPGSALATLTVLTGDEYTRRRILKIVRDECGGELDTSLLPEHLRILAEKFEGEDVAMDQLIDDFKENKNSLNELIGGLQELTAQIDLPQDFAEEHTILITDDTVVEHHTLCD